MKLFIHRKDLRIDDLAAFNYLYSSGVPSLHLLILDQHANSCNLTSYVSCSIITAYCFLGFRGAHRQTGPRGNTQRIRCGHGGEKARESYRFSDITSRLFPFFAAK